MKKLFRSRWTRLTLALCMSMVLLSTAAYAAEDTTGGGTSASVISAFLLCLSLLPGHAYAAKESDLPQPPVIEEPLGPEPVMVMSEEMGLYEDDHL